MWTVRSRRFLRRDLRGVALAAALGGLGLRETAAQGILPAGCRSRLQFCDDASQCCGQDSNREVKCDCCRGFRCKGHLCR